MLKSCFVSLIFLLLFSPTVNADSVTFDLGSVTALQYDSAGNLVYVNLASNPGVLLTPTTIDFSTGTRSLNVDFNLSPFNEPWFGIVRYDWVLNGVASTTFNLNCQNGCSPLFITGGGSFLDYTTPFYSPVPASVTISVINNAGTTLGSANYTFQIAEPVPEPATVLLLTTALGGLLVTHKCKRKGRR